MPLTRRLSELQFGSRHPPWPACIPTRDRHAERGRSKCISPPPTLSFSLSLSLSSSVSLSLSLALPHSIALSLSLSRLLFISLFLSLLALPLSIALSLCLSLYCSLSLSPSFSLSVIFLFLSLHPRMSLSVTWIYLTSTLQVSPVSSLRRCSQKRSGALGGLFLHASSEVERVSYGNKDLAESKSGCVAKQVFPDKGFASDDALQDCI